MFWLVCLSSLLTFRLLEISQRKKNTASCPLVAKGKNTSLAAKGAPPATPHRLQNPKWPPGALKLPTGSG